MLQVAAVCGRVFRRQVVERLALEDAPAENLTLLERDSFVYPLTADLETEPTYAFRHALIQEVAYQRQLQAQPRGWMCRPLTW